MPFEALGDSPHSVLSLEQRADEPRWSVSSLYRIQGYHRQVLAEPPSFGVGAILSELQRSATPPTLTPQQNTLIGGGGVGFK